MNVQCRTCQMDNREGARFCNRCGASLAEAKTPVTTVPAAGDAGRQDRPSMLPEATAAARSTLVVSQGEAPSTSSGWHPLGTSGGETNQTGSSRPGISDAGPIAQKNRPGWLPERKIAEPEVAHSNRPDRSPKTKKLVGQAREFRERYETAGNLQWTIWSFRLERYDESGNRLRPVQVEMRAQRFRGAISEGDWVEVPGRWREGKIMHPRQVHNVTASANVRGEVPFATRVNRAIGAFVEAVMLPVGVVSSLIGTALYVGFIALIVFVIVYLVSHH